VSKPRFTNLAKSGSRAAVARQRQAAARAPAAKQRAASLRREPDRSPARRDRSPKPAPMARVWALVEDPAREVRPPRDGILSRTLFEDASVRLVIFGFGPGQELSEHAASRPVVLQVLEGRATLRLGAETREVGPGAWIHLPAGLPHAVRAQTPLVLLLSLLRG
jgi:quercetin dioxygenase-like cupin family protein